MKSSPSLVLLFAFLFPAALSAREYHVSPAGKPANDGSAASPFPTISAAAKVVQPGDTITVHEGVYRERVTPPRGGESDAKRITYQAAPGETVVIKGSEVARGWTRFTGDVWKLTLPRSFFGRYNPYQDLINGDWFTDRGRPHHTGEVYLNGKSLYESHLLQRVLEPATEPDSRDPEGSTWTWFCESDGKNTYIYANFHGRNPNDELVEINVRDSCFYPDKPGCDFITVRGFRMAQTATQWAAPTAEQIGLIGTHWSKGWIIEHNVISDSKCSGITLGKDRATGHNVWNNDRSKDGATHYNEVIVRALAAGWARAKIGSHIVRDNVIFNCEQTGICGSLGAVYSEISRNHIHHIWTKRQFRGAEIAGIKLHGAIDVRIQNNRIHNAGRGLWMDWMAQGTRITANLCYDNTTDDLFVEVNHGPFVVDNNVFLSAVSLNDMSEGGAYAHNLLAGRIDSRPEPGRSTPFQVAHETTLGGLSTTAGGDDRFFNNIIFGGDSPPVPSKPAGTKATSRAIGYGLWVYDGRAAPLQAAGNVFLNGARPYAAESKALAPAGNHAPPRITEEAGAVFLHLEPVAGLKDAATVRVTTALLGRAKVPDLPYENPDGSPLALDQDFFGKTRPAKRPLAGPFELGEAGAVKLKVW
ncbi:MAG: right-handed parallel beta-helix repeat-containing protein [Opitutaceae bacterium]|nr:right-handed parallel beta-helix repeat-containing protein [Opitutaceae bacterium]